MIAPAQDIALKVVHPAPGENLTISHGSTFAIGTVAPTNATVFINGVAADMSNDGAFIAMAPLKMLPKPKRIKLAGGASKQVDAMFECVAKVGDKTIRQQILVSTPAVHAVKEPPIRVLEKPLLYRVVQEQVLSQTTTTNWGLLYIPKDATVIADARKGDRWRLQLSNAQETWLNQDILRRADAMPAVANIVVTNVSPNETRFDVGTVVPYSIEQTLAPPQLLVTLHCPDTNRPFALPSPSARPWGFDARYVTNTLIVTQRAAPVLPTGLRGKIVCLDPGHNPDTGAIGPRGLEEREANLKIGLALEKLLTDAGAKVVFTHRGEPLLLRDRRPAALRLNPDIFVSLHNNSVPDGTDPRTNSGASTFYYHPQSRALADSVQAALLAELGFPDLKVNQKSLFVCRTTEFPAILVEPAFIILPDQEKLLLSEPGQQKIAKAIFDGIKKFFEAK